MSKFFVTNLSSYTQELEQYHKWLSGFGEDRLNHWERLLDSNPEAALCEACTLKLLYDHQFTLRIYC